MTELKRKTLEFQRAYIAERLQLLTQAQREFFHRLYPKGPREEQILNAADQIDRTIAKNARKSPKESPK